MTTTRSASSMLVMVVSTITLLVQSFSVAAATTNDTSQTSAIVAHGDNHSGFAASPAVDDNSSNQHLAFTTRTSYNALIILVCLIAAVLGGCAILCCAVLWFRRPRSNHNRDQPNVDPFPSEVADVASHILSSEGYKFTAFVAKKAICPEMTDFFFATEKLKRLLSSFKCRELEMSPGDDSAGDHQSRLQNRSMFYRLLGFLSFGFYKSSSAMAEAKAINATLGDIANDYIAFDCDGEINIDSISRQQLLHEIKVANDTINRPVWKMQILSQDPAEFNHALEVFDEAARLLVKAQTEVLCLLKDGAFRWYNQLLAEEQEIHIEITPIPTNEAGSSLEAGATPSICIVQTSFGDHSPQVNLDLV